MTLVAVITGTPGVGKSTACRQLALRADCERQLAVLATTDSAP